MMDDLAENVLPGLTKSEIVSLLENPDYVWQLEEGEWGYWQPGKDGGKLMYIVGPEKGLGVDNQCLLIDFDERDIFQSYSDVPCG